jgi:hypothetical protein
MAHEILDTFMKQTFSRIFFTFAVVTLLIFTGACSRLSLSDSSQFTNQVVAPSFVSELYGTRRQVITINHAQDSHIGWIGFVQSKDYRFFKIVKVTAGGKTIVEDGTSYETLNSETVSASVGTELSPEAPTFTSSPTAIVPEFSIGASTQGDNTVDNGQINVAGTGDLKITIEYTPLSAVESDAAPHEATLIAFYDRPSTGAMSITLKGYTQGVKAEKCAQAMESMTATTFDFQDGAFDLYFCSAEVAKFNQNNTPQDPSDPDYHGRSTNLTPVPISGQFSFFQPDDETVCILSEPEPSLPAFDLPVPPGVGPEGIDFLPVELEPGSFAECSLSPDGIIRCEDTIQIKTLLAVSNLSMTNAEVTAEEINTSDCPDFGNITGSGTFPNSPLEFIAWGRVLNDSNAEAFNIVDSGIIAVIRLE